MKTMKKKTAKKGEGVWVETGPGSGVYKRWANIPKEDLVLQNVLTGSVKERGWVMKDQKITACDIELAVARMFNFRANLIVPNVSWGLNLGWEADLLVLRPSGYLIEVEIKTTKNDLLKDKTKTKWGRFELNKIIKYHFYAVPETLAELVWRMDSGIISVSLFKEKYWAKIVRPAKIVQGVQPLKSDRRQKLAELGAMRIWDLKETLLKRREKEESKEKGGE